MKPFTRYTDVLAYMFVSLPMYQRVGAPAYKKDLTNTILLLEAMGNPHLDIQTIHIAGTNGKGSTSHLIAGGLQAQGYRVGLYTSPHYKDFRERIKINGELVPANYIKNFINKYYTDLEQIKPSFFEMTVALAFSYFKEKKVDFAVIETGLGGRLDSTNVITPLLSVITNISYDHVQMLGDTLEKIAFEKAGIIKAGVPVIIGEKQPEVEAVFREKSQQTGSKLYYADDLVTVSQAKNLPEGTYTIARNGKPWMPSICIDIGGPFQNHNIKTAFAALSLLSDKVALDGKKMSWFFPSLSTETKFLGRWQVLSKKPFILADSAHNEGGFKYLVDYLCHLQTNLHIVLGFVNDKDISLLLSMLPKNATYYFAKADIPRGLPAEELQKQAASHGLGGKSYTSVKRAFSAAKKSLKPDDALFVGGSIFVVAEIL